MWTRVCAKACAACVSAAGCRHCCLLCGPGFSLYLACTKFMQAVILQSFYYFKLVSDIPMASANRTHHRFHAMQWNAERCTQRACIGRGTRLRSINANILKKGCSFRLVAVKRPVLTDITKSPLFEMGVSHVIVMQFGRSIPTENDDSRHTGFVYRTRESIGFGTVTNSAAGSLMGLVVAHAFHELRTLQAIQQQSEHVAHFMTLEAVQSMRLAAKVLQSCSSVGWQLYHKHTIYPHVVV